MDEILDEAGVKEILDFDPFAELDGKAAAAPEEEAAPAAEPEPEPEPEQPAPQESAPTPATAPNRDEELLREIRALRAQQAPPPAPAPAPKEEEYPNYNFDIPDNLIAAIRSEDTGQNKAAIQYIIAQTALAVHKAVRPEYKGQIQSAVESYVNRHVAARREEDSVQNDFYSRYPEYNTPAGRALVVAAAQELISNDPNPRYTKELGDKIAARVKETVAGFAGQPAGGQQQQQQPKQEQQKQQQKRPQQVKQGTRPVAAKPDVLASEVQDTLFGRG